MPRPGLASPSLTPVLQAGSLRKHFMRNPIWYIKSVRPHLKRHMPQNGNILRVS